MAEPHSSNRVRLFVPFGSQRGESVLDDGRQPRVRPGEVGKLVDDNGDGLVASQRQQGVHDLAPVPEGQRRRSPDPLGEGRPDAVQRLAVRGFLGRVVETTGGLAQGSEQESLALPPPSGHHRQRGAGRVVRREGSESGPLAVPLEHLGGPGK